MSKNHNIIDEQKAQIEKLKKENALIPQLQQKIADQDAEIQQLKKTQPEEADLVESFRQKIRIEMLNFIFEKLGYDTKWITENHKQSALARVYAAIMGTNHSNALRGNVGKVTYAKRPSGIDEEISNVNKILQDINKEWSIQL